MGWSPAIFAANRVRAIPASPIASGLNRYCLIWVNFAGWLSHLCDTFTVGTPLGSAHLHDAPRGVDPPALGIPDPGDFVFRPCDKIGPAATAIRINSAKKSPGREMLQDDG